MATWRYEISLFMLKNISLARCAHTLKSFIFAICCKRRA